MINQFAWVFYIFGAILIFMAGKQVSEEFSSDSGDDDADNVMTRFFRKYLRTSEHYDGDKMVTTVNGKRMLTPMLLVMLSIGGTDLLFALDSIPAIFGLTQETYLVFTAVVFSLLGGLRQLYFLIDGLLDRLVYLTWGGLAAILAFIGGVKLILHALHENNVPFINGGGEPVQVVEISTGLSLAVIIGGAGHHRDRLADQSAGAGSRATSPMPDATPGSTWTPTPMRSPPSRPRPSGRCWPRSARSRSSMTRSVR